MVARVGSALRWIEIPDLASRRLALSSLLVGVREVEAKGAAEQQQVQFSVDHRFARASRLSFMLFIYNASRVARGAGSPGLTLQARILRGSRPVLTTPQREVTFEGKDSARIPFGGEVPLGSLPAGRYTLEVTVTDRAAAASATQRADLTVE